MGKTMLRRLLCSLLIILLVPETVHAQSPRSDADAKYIEQAEDARKRFGEDSSQYLRELAALVYHYDLRQQQEKALPWAKRYTELTIRMHGDASQDARDFLLDLVRRHLRLGARAESATYYERYLASLRKGDVDARDVADAEHYLALFLSDAGQHDAAFKQFSSSVAANERTYGKCHRLTAAALIDWARADALFRGGKRASTLRDQAEAILKCADARAGMPSSREAAIAESMDEELDKIVRTLGFVSQPYTGRLGLLLDHYDKSGYVGGALRLAYQAVGITNLLAIAEPYFGDLLFDMGNKHLTLDEKQDALRAYQRSLPGLSHQYGSESQEFATATYNIALVLKNMGNNEKATELFAQSISIFEEKLGKDHPQIGLGRANWAAALLRLGNGAAAAKMADAAQSILEKAPSLPADQDVAAFASICEVYLGTGRSEQGLAFAKSALDRARAAYGDDSPLIGGYLNSLAVFANSLGRHGDALKWAAQAVEKLTRSFGQSHPSLTDPLGTLAEAYFRLGQNDKALELTRKSLEITRNVFGLEGTEVARAQANLAVLTDDPAQAIQLLERSKQIFLRHQDHLSAAKVAHNLAAAHAQSLSFDKAIEVEKENLVALATMHPDGHPALLKGRMLIGMAEFFSMKPDQAIKTLHDALARAELGAGTELVESGAHMILCLAYAFKKQEDLSIVWGKQAVNAHQRWRGAQTGLDAAMRDSLARNSRMTYEMVATLLVRQGRIDEAQTILRMLKENELFEVLRGAGDDPRLTRIELTGLEQERFSRYYALRSQQAELATERQNLERKRTAQALTAVEMERLKEIRDKLMPVAAEAMRSFLKRLEADMAAAPGKAVQNSTSLSREAGALRKTVDELSRSEPAAGAVAVQYAVSEDTLTIIISPPGAPPIAHQRAIKRADLYRNIQTALLQIGDAKSDPRIFKPALQALYALLIGDIRPDLEKLGARTLMLSLDSELRLLPFAALMDKQGRYLIEDYALALYNEAAANELQHPAPATIRVAAMGLSQPVDGLPALSHVPDELTKVKNSGGEGGAIYLNDEFTRPRFDATIGRSTQSMFNVLHVASHFRFQYGAPAASWLYLGDKSRLSLLDLANADLRLNGFDLVAYSACETGKGGGRDQAGQVMESLGAVTQRKGAQAVLATLWKVADQSTALLMADFYKQRAQGRANKAEAMRLAQLGMAHGKGDQSGPGSWTHPYYWAPFVVMGNWR